MAVLSMNGDVHIINLPTSRSLALHLCVLLMPWPFGIGSIVVYGVVFIEDIFVSCGAQSCPSLHHRDVM